MNWESSVVKQNGVADYVLQGANKKGNHMLKIGEFKLKKQTWKQLLFNVNAVRISIPGLDFEIIFQISIISKNKDKLVERECKQI